MPAPWEKEAFVSSLGKGSSPTMGHFMGQFLSWHGIKDSCVRSCDLTQGSGYGRSLLHQLSSLPGLNHFPSAILEAASLEVSVPCSSSLCCSALHFQVPVVIGLDSEQEVQCRTSHLCSLLMSCHKRTLHNCSYCCISAVLV